MKSNLAVLAVLCALLTTGPATVWAGCQNALPTDLVLDAIANSSIKHMEKHYKQSSPEELKERLRQRIVTENIRVASAFNGLPELRKGVTRVYATNKSTIIQQWWNNSANGASQVFTAKVDELNIKGGIMKCLIEHGCTEQMAVDGNFQS